MNKEFKNAILSAALVGVLGASVETITSAQTQEIPGHLNPGTALAERGKENNPMHRPKVEDVGLKNPTDMIARSIERKGPNGIRARMPIEGYAKLLKVYGPSGSEEAARRLKVEIEKQHNLPLLPLNNNVQAEDGKTTAGPLQKRTFQVPYIGVEALLGPDYRELSPEFAWVADFAKKGLITGFSFVELRPGSVFNNNSIAYKPKANSPLYPKAELGFANGKPFGSAGVEWNIKQTFPISKVFNAATVTYFHKLYGVTPKQQIALFWDTNSVKAFGLDIDTQGFIRLRPGSPGKYGQPQLTIGAKWLPKGVRGLLQWDVSGDNATKKTHASFSAGIKVYPTETSWYKKLTETFKRTRN